MPSFMSSLSSAVSGQGPSASLPPAPAPGIGVFRDHLHNSEVILKLTESRMSWTGDDFTIKDAQGRPAFECRAKAMSVHGRKEFYDASGRHLFTVIKRILAIHATFDGVDPKDDDKVLFTVKKGFSLGAKLSVKFKNIIADGQEQRFELRGDWFDRKAELTWNGVPVARIGRSFLNIREAMFDKQTYYLSVAPGVDAAMLVAVAICLDEAKNEQK